MKISVIVTAHNNNPNPIIDCLSNQLRRPDEILVGLSGECEKPDNDEGIIVKYYEDKKDYGYSKRNELADVATGDVLAFFSCDDSYRRDYLAITEKVMESLGGDVVWCHWISSVFKTPAGHKHLFKPGNSTLGNFIVKRNVFTSVGKFQKFSDELPDPGLYDAGLINALNISPDELSIIEVPHYLYFHNIPYDIRASVTSWGKQVGE